MSNRTSRYLRVLPGGHARDALSVKPRWPVLDGARGAAVVAMVAYHTAWDLSFLGLIGTDVVASPGWSLFARAVAASFLTLSGIGLVLAHGDGVRWRAFGRRFAIVAGAALLITAVTRAAFPDTYIFFGILHCIAVSSLLALPFLRAPLALVALAAGFSFAAPGLFASAAFDTAAFRWTGLGTVPPATNDWVPIFPWFGWVLAGAAAGRLGLRRIRPGTAPRHPAGGFAGALIWCGRRSLPIYLLHQPLIFGVLFLAAQAVGPEEAAERAPFLDACARSCAGTGRDGATCARACRCVASGAERERLWSPLVRGRLSEPERERVLALTRACFAEPEQRPGLLE